jgi:hypothetical protein
MVRVDLGLRNLPRLLLRLYPRGWRDRYEDEVCALIEDGPPRWQTVPDLLAGALKEQFHMQSLTRLIGWLSAAGLAAGFLASFAITPQYNSHATVELRAAGARGILDTVRGEAGSRAALAQLIMGPRLDLYTEERTRTPLETVEDDMRRDFTLSPPYGGDPNVARLTISFTYRDKMKATSAIHSTIAYMNEALYRYYRDTSTERTIVEERYLHQIAVLETRIKDLEKRLGIVPSIRSADQRAEAGQPYELKTIEMPVVAVTPVSPNRAACAFTGFGAGIVMAFVIALARRRPYAAPDPVALS